MAPKSRFFGYWISSVDEASARDAVKMAGLPILIVGINALLLALMTAANPVGDMTTAGISAALACLMFVLAFRIRAGHAAWVPVAAVLFVLFVGFNALSGYIAWKTTGGGQTTGAQIVLGWIVPMICMVFTVAGLKGWLWLRTHGAKRSL